MNYTEQPGGTMVCEKMIDPSLEVQFSWLKRVPLKPAQLREVMEIMQREFEEAQMSMDLATADESQDSQESQAKPASGDRKRLKREREDCSAAV
jgi:hypothetical protein